MNEFDILHRYSNAQAAADGLGLRLTVSKSALELRDARRGMEEYARCRSLDEVEQALARRRGEVAAGDGEASLY